MATAAELDPNVLKEVYAQASSKQYTHNTPLLRLLKRDTSFHTDTKDGGAYKVLSLKVRGKVSGGARPRSGVDLPTPKRSVYKRATVHLKNIYITGSLIGRDQYDSSGAGYKAFVDAYSDEVADMAEWGEVLINKYLNLTHSGTHGTIGEIEGAGTEADPFIITPTKERAIRAKWILEDMDLEFGTVNSLGDGVETAGGCVVRVTDVDEDANTFTCHKIAAGTSPVPGKDIFVFGEVNECPGGLDEILGDDTHPYLGVDPSSERQWKALRINAGQAAYSVDKLTALANRLRTKNKNLILTATPGMVDKAYKDGIQQVRYVQVDEKGPKVAWGETTEFLGYTWERDEQAPLGTVRFIDKTQVKVLGGTDWKWMTQGGEQLMRFQFRDEQFMAQKNYMDFYADRRNTSAELYNIAQTSPWA